MSFISDDQLGAFANLHHPIEKNHDSRRSIRRILSADPVIIE